MGKIGFSQIRQETLKLRFQGSVEPKGIERIELLGIQCPMNAKTSIRVVLWTRPPIGPLVGAGFRLSSLPGCCGVLVSHESYVTQALQRRGLGLLMQEMKEFIAREYRVGKMIATVLQGNKAEETLLLKTGWRPGVAFRNRRTDNLIVEWEKTFTY